MAVRTTSALVGGIIEVDDDIDLTPFIDVANVLVTECCSADDYDANRLKLIETWMAAHCYSIRDMRVEAEGASGMREKLQSKVDLGFDTSHYGQMAMRLDTAGGLAALNKKSKEGGKVTVGITWCGTPETEA